MFADVTSANVVGYNNKLLQDGGKKMVCSSFMNVTAESGIWLSELTVAGYQDSDYYKEEGVSGAFSVKILGYDGTPLATYIWKDNFDGDEWEGGFWEDSDSQQKIEGKTDATDVFLKAGISLWTEAPELEDCEEFRFGSAGTVKMTGESILMQDGGKKGIGNMFASDIWLSQIGITGYEDSDFYKEEGVSGAFSAKILGYDGTPLATYIWKDNFDGDEWEGGYWEDSDSQQKIEGEDDATDVRLSSGDGLWCEAPELEDCEEFYLNFPQPSYSTIK